MFLLYIKLLKVIYRNKNKIKNIIKGNYKI